MGSAEEADTPLQTRGPTVIPHRFGDPNRRSDVSLQNYRSLFYLDTTFVGFRTLFTHGDLHL